MRNVLIIIALILTFWEASAQFTLSPIQSELRGLVSDAQHGNGAVQSPFLPVILPSAQLDSICDAMDQHGKSEPSSWVMRKLTREHLIEIKDKDFQFRGDLGLNLEGARQLDPSGRRMYTNTRGIKISGSVGKRMFFESSFYETQSIFPAYMDSVVSRRGFIDNTADPERGSVPGFGRWKPFNTSSSYDYDYTLVTGSVGYALNDRTFVQFGHDRQFLGFGYRSMFLSDVSSPYPFLRFHGSFFKDKLSYTTTWAVLQSLDRIAPNYNLKEAMFRRLGGRFTYIQYNPFSWMGIGIFDGTTWTWRDNNHPASMEYYSPQFGFYSGLGIVNHLIGVNGNVRPFTSLNVYGQLGVNRTSKGKVAQAGIRWSGLPKGLSFVLEWNHTGNNAYYGGPDSMQTAIFSEPFAAGTQVLDYYQHNDQSLAHPLLIANDEYLMRLRYQVHGFFVRSAFHFVRKNPVFINHTQSFVCAEFGYVLNRRSNAQLVVGNIKRLERDGVREWNDTYTYVALRIDLINRYLDF